MCVLLILISSLEHEELYLGIWKVNYISIFEARLQKVHYLSKELAIYSEYNTE